MYRAIKPVLATALVVLSHVVPAAADGTPTISGIRHRSIDAGVRLMFDVTPAPAFAIFTLTEPDRLVIDFPRLNWQLPQFAATGSRFIHGVRYGLFRRDRARVVVDLAEPLGVERAYNRPPEGAEPGQLIIDLAPIARETFAARSGYPEQARWHDDAPPVPAAVAAGDIVIAVDPGHGGIDPGAMAGDLTEKDLVLEFAGELIEHINALPGLSAYLTRDSDVFVPLAERVARARRVGAHAIISIHADSVQQGQASGVSVYTLSEKGTDEAADALAARENRSDVLAGADLVGESDDLTRLLVELAQRGTSDESAKLAGALLEAMGQQFELLRTRPLRQANFRVLKSPEIPSVLLELGFLDNPRDQARLTDPAWRARAARATAAGIAAWSRRASPGFVTPRHRSE